MILTVKDDQNLIRKTDNFLEQLNELKLDESLSLIDQYLSQFTATELLASKEWLRQEKFYRKPILQLTSMSVIAFLWNPSDITEYHRHHNYQNGFSHAFIKVLKGKAFHEVAEIVDETKPFIKLRQCYSEIVKPGMITQVQPEQAHALGNFGCGQMLSIHLYITPVKNVDEQFCLIS
ncbi:hypothetical protein PCC9214_02436 [Planktothrix tepida]|uniref:Uncharacterized protein n=2 Tax=Planktothrix TaxID=54304 RepID=A0A1J1LJ02_9CYAN|nr:MULTISPECIES: hypothetical protein [Planktothrix]CAD5949108.1 hypothetical protein PCC9214_02436 [Planktothrix tepida]CAD5961658.1 hypothetical protein NO713_03240 [Planktothrix pseudagardhii]CUR32479.1 hypothetical protein PL9214490026 [Planktothrix tepida PCC 9214]